MSGVDSIGKKKINNSECQIETLLGLNMSVAVAASILTLITNVKITVNVGGATVIDGGNMIAAERDVGTKGSRILGIIGPWNQGRELEKQMTREP